MHTYGNHLFAFCKFDFKEYVQYLLAPYAAGIL